MGRDLRGGVADIISGGNQRPPRRWAAILGVLALVAVGVAGFLTRRDPGPHHQVIQPQLRTPYPVDFPLLRARTGLRLYAIADLGSDGEMVSMLDVDTGRSAEVRGVPQHMRARLQLVPIRGGVAVITPRCGDCGYAAGAFVYVVRGDHSVRRFETAGQAVPAATDTTLWIVRGGLAYQVDLAGHAVTPRYRLPPSSTLIRGTRHGLLLDATGHAEVWDPATRRVVLRTGLYSVLGTTQIGWTRPTCTRECPLRITDLQDRRLHTTSTGIYLSPPGSVLRPDGAWLAWSDSEPGWHAISVVEVGTGRGRTLLHADGDTELNWSSGWLLISTAIRPPVNYLYLWRPGMDRPVRAENAVPGQQFVVGG